MKIDPIFYEDYLKNKFENINIIFLYGTNIGLVDLTYKKTLEILKIDTNNPFSVSKLDGNEFKDNPVTFKKGDWFMTGSVIQPFKVNKGDKLKVDFRTLGKINVDFI